MNLKSRTIFFFISGIIPFFSSAQIVVSTVSPANAANVVLNNFLAPSGVMPGSVQNVSFTGVPGSLATFTGTSNVGFTEGIILSSDNCNYITNPASSQISGPNNTTGDPQLQSIASGTVQDAAVLQFDFQPLTDTLRFRYVFGSEEYPEYVCSGFNDVFGFFITGPNPGGPNYNNYNIARIPGTNLPVSINSVNPGVPGANSGGGNCSGPDQSLAYSSLYNANNGITIIFDGLTHVLEAKIAVKICGTYHIKLAVGNCNDGVFDSGIFLEANSFGGNFVPVQVTGGIQVSPDSAFLCVGDTITLTAPNSMQYNWGVYGTTQSILVTQPGSYQLLLHNSTYSCVQNNIPFHVILDPNCFVGLNDNDQEELFTVSPNPFTDEILIQSSEIFLKGTVISILNLNGEELKRVEIMQSSKDISVSLKDLKTGIYFLKFISEKEITTRKIIRL